MHRDQRIAHALRELRYLETGIGGVVAAVVEKVSDVVRAEDFDQPLVLGAILVEARELIAAGTERACGRLPESSDRPGRLLARVDQVFGQRADDAVSPGIQAPDPRGVLTGGFDDGAGGRVEDRGHAAGLRIEGVAFGHCGIPKRSWEARIVKCLSSSVQPDRPGGTGDGWPFHSRATVCALRHAGWRGLGFLTS